MKKLLLINLLFLTSLNASAGIYSVTSHSRANCAGFNESISWHLGHSYWFWVNSQHINASTGAIVHTLVSGWQATWRNAQYHVNEGYGGWSVQGLHWMLDSYNQPYLVSRQQVNDCSIYDGWWDQR